MAELSYTDDFAIKGAAAAAAGEGGGEGERSPPPPPSASAAIPQKGAAKTALRRSRSPEERRGGRARSRSPLRYESESGSEDGEARDTAPAPLAEEPSQAEVGEGPPPLPEEPLPADDGWEVVYLAGGAGYYFSNRFTGVSQYQNPRDASDTNLASAAAYQASLTTYGGLAAPPGTTAALQPYAAPPGTTQAYQTHTSPPPGQGYNPKIHGSFDPNAEYAKYYFQEEAAEPAPIDTAEVVEKISQYGQTGRFNRRTGAFQAGKGAEYHDDHHKSGRQMNNFFDVDRAANAHNGRSLKEERRNKPISKAQAKAFNEAKKAKKHKKEMAFLTS